MRLASESPRFRPDIEGLRAVAVLLVVVFHSGLPLPGGFVGVDVFFVISGFLITGVLVREIDASGTINLVAFYGRRAKRLVPAASAVLLTTTLLTWRLSPIAHRSVFVLDVASAGAFALNWRLADRSVDYLAADVGRSPVLHFWSLSLEEQFYFLWPPLLWVGLIFARRASRSPRGAIGGILAIVVVASFAWSVAFTSVSAPRAFFVTGTRLWELGLGGLLVLFRPHLAQCAPGRGLPVASAGLALIALSATAIRGYVGWPGWLALCPTLGAVLVIAGGSIHPGNLASRLLSSSPLVWIGGLSYSLYLWHWPILVVAQDWLDLHARAWGVGLAIASIVPAWLSHRLIERPTRFSRELAEQPKLAVSAGIGLSLACISAALLVHVAHTTSRQTTMGTVRSVPLGAMALGIHPGSSKAGAPQSVYDTMTPSPAAAASDVSAAYREGCLVAFPVTEPRWCELGDPNAKYRIVMLGDSKIFQYADTFDEIGRALGWRIVAAAKAGCPFADALGDSAPNQCRAFNAKVLERLRADPPNAIITSQIANEGFLASNPSVFTTQIMVDGLARRWSEVASWGTRVVVLLDNPSPPPLSVYDCLLRSPGEHDKCAFDRKTGIELSAAPTQRMAAARVSEVRVIDLTDHICPQPKCAPVIGDVLVYRQGTHLTNTYARSLAPILATKLTAALSP